MGVRIDLTGFILDFRIPQEQSTPPNHVDARANDQNVCKGVFCSIALASKRPRCSTTTVWSRGKVGQRVL